MPRTPGRADYYEPGDWNAVCSMCGRKRKGSMLVKNWQGQWRCPQHNEPRQPQDFVRGVPETMPPPFVQPQQSIFVGVCSPEGITAICDYGVGDCCICDYMSPNFERDIT